MATPECLRIVFMGTPEFARTILKKIYEEKNLDIVGVLAQPDKQAGRGLKNIEIGAVKKFAIENGLSLFQPESLKNDAIVESIIELKPDFIVVAAYGKIIPENIISIPKFDCINVHASLLPAFRGAAPVQRAIMESWNGREETGVSIMRVVKELDAGPVYSQKKIAIGNRASDSLLSELAQAGANLLIKTIYDIVNLNLIPQEQESDKATYARKLTKEEGFINCNHYVEQLDAQIRAVSGWPGARMNLKFNDKIPAISLQFTISGFKKENIEVAQIGKIIADKKVFKIICKNGHLILDKIKPQGKKWMTAKDFFNGIRYNNQDEYGIVI